MTPERWQQISRALDEFLLMEPSQQALQLPRLRKSDPELAAEVESLLRQTAGIDLDRVMLEVCKILESADSPASKTSESYLLPAQVGAYQLQEWVGEGGMGVVFRARDEHFRRSLAVKFLKLEQQDDADLKRRFVEEAQLMGQLQHPGISPVYDMGELPDGRPYFAMKLVKGKTLADILKERSSPDEDQPRLLGIFEQLCQTLAFAHKQGVIHRDLKPANVMVGAFGEVQVMDWGLAKVLAAFAVQSAEAGQTSTIYTIRAHEPDSWTKNNIAMGTPAYMAPEQARGEVESLDERCDVFGLGAVLCEILTGKPPFTGRTSREVLEQAQQGKTESALARLEQSGAERELVQLARQCLATSKEDRPANAGMVLQATTAYLAAVQERLRQTELARAQAAVRAVEERKRWRLTLALATFAFAAVVGLGIAWYWVEQTGAAARTQTAVQVNHELGRAASLRDQAEKAGWRAANQRKESARLWEEAVAAAEKAETIFAAGPANPETRQAVEESVSLLRTAAADAARNRAMLDELDKARDMRGVITDKDYLQVHPRSVIAFGHAATEAYAAAFRGYGIDVLALPAAEAARQIRAKPISEQLIAALDDWLALEVDQPPAQRLLDVCRAADSDPFRNRLRSAVAAIDRDTLKQLAQEARGMDLPVSATLLLADGLHLAGEVDTAVAMLRQAQRLHPDDFWINDILGVYLLSEGPTGAEEASRCFSAAIARRPESYFVHDNLGQALLVRCRWREAQEAFETAIRHNSDFMFAQISLSNALAEQGELDKAITICEKIIAKQPTSIVAHRALAEHYQTKGEKGKALAVAQKLKDNASNWPYAHVILGYQLLYHERVEEAIANFEQARKLRPHLADAHVGLVFAFVAGKDKEKAVAALQQARKYGPNRPDVYLGQAALHDLEGKLPDAVAACRHAIALQPRYWGLHQKLGDLCMRANSVNEAIAAYEEAIRLKPDEAHLHNALGNALHQNKAWDRAIAAYEKAIQLKATEAVFHSNLGGSLSSKGLPRALDAYLKALELDSNRVDANRGVALISMKQKNYDLAVKHFEKIIAVSPNHVAVRIDLGFVHREKREYDKAIAHLQQAIKIDKTNPIAFNNLGLAAFRKGECEQAIQYLQQGIHVDRKYGPIYNNLAFALTWKGDRSGTIACCRQYLRAIPDDAKAHIGLAEALAEDGQFEAAREQLRHFASEASPGKDAALKELQALLALETKLPEVVKGTAKAPDFVEAMRFGKLCRVKQHYTASLRCYDQAIALDAKRLNSLDRFVLAQVALLAGTGHGYSPPRLEEQPKYRKRALEFLRQYLHEQEKQLLAKREDYRFRFQEMVRRPLWHVDFAVVRSPALANLPKDEREEWQQLWTEMDNLFSKAMQKK